eukprot:166176-Heterocapsa_arctica.AAC.1
MIVETPHKQGSCEKYCWGGALKGPPSRGSKRSLFVFNTTVLNKNNMTTNCYNLRSSLFGRGLQYRR